MRLWPNYVQLVTVKGTGINSVADLKGKRVGVGAANSGVEINARMILNAYGITYDDITPTICLWRGHRQHEERPVRRGVRHLRPAQLHHYGPGRAV